MQTFPRSLTWDEAGRTMAERVRLIEGVNDMGWNINGELVESCSCNMLCPCWYGVKELMIMDQGWCASPWLIRIREGSSDGVDLSGCNAVLTIFFPGPTLLDGNGTGRVYIDERASEDQRREIETIFQGNKEGPLVVPASLTSSWLPTQFVPIDVTEDDGEIEATVGEIGKIVSTRLVNEQGNVMTMQNAGFVVALQLEDMTAELAPSDGTFWRDPELPQQWECKSGAVGRISWRVD